MYSSTLFSLTSVAIAAWIASSPVTCVFCEGEDQGGRTTDASQTLDSCFSRRVSRETRRRGRANARRTGLKSSSESRANPRKPANERARTARQSSFRVRACVGSDAEGEGGRRDRWIESSRVDYTLVSIRPRWRGERRSLRTFPGEDSNRRPRRGGRASERGALSRARGERNDVRPPRPRRGRRDRGRGGEVRPCDERRGATRGAAHGDVRARRR